MITNPRVVDAMDAVRDRLDPRILRWVRYMAKNAPRFRDQELAEDFAKLEELVLAVLDIDAEPAAAVAEESAA